MKLIFITSNAGKLREANDWLLPALPPDSVVEGRDLVLAEEQTLDIKSLVCRKVEQATLAVKSPLLVDDTALCFNAWDGLPGPFVKFFVEKIGNQGLYNALASFYERGAVAICALGYHDGKQTHYFETRLTGQIVSPRGMGGFGWDALFQPVGSEQTLAEMDTQVRHKFSMRARAFEQLASHLSAENTPKS